MVEEASLSLDLEILMQQELSFRWNKTSRFNEWKV